MAKNIFVGVNGVAKKPKAIYVGVNGVARKVKAAYVGVNGVARKVWPNSILPDTYKRLEYISRTTIRSGSNTVMNSARINTGVIADAYTKIFCKFMLISTTDSFSYHYVFKAAAARDTYPSYGFSLNNYVYTGNSKLNGNISFYNKSYNHACTDSHTNILYELTFNDNGKFYLNNTLIYTATDYSGSETTETIRIFNPYYINQTYTSPGNMRLYAFKIWKNNTTLVRDMYPCYRKSDNVNGMYDIINNVFYSNEVTDHPEDFARGPEVDE